METKHKIFKPFDKVLVRDDYNEWYCAFYSHYRDDKDGGESCHFVTSGGGYPDDEILPYEGNEHLVGTANEQPYEEVNLETGEHLYVFNDKHDFPNNLSFSKFYYATKGSIKTFNGVNAIHTCWNYAIRFSDFNPSDMEETKKHILCVKNGKVVKLK